MKYTVILGIAISVAVVILFPDKTVIEQFVVASAIGIVIVVTIHNLKGKF